MAAADALRSLLHVRYIAPSGDALAAHLRSRGVQVHPNTLRLLLSGKRTPRPSTIEKILTGLDATDVERALFRSSGAEAGPDLPAPTRVSLLDALVDSELIDRGREREEVLWHYQVGDTDAEDVCREVRRTTVGSEGLQVVSFGPGQFGGGAPSLEALNQLDLRVAVQLISDFAPRPVPAQVHVLHIEPERRGFGMVLQFAEMEPGSLIEWSVRYRWPGLWRSLRLKGFSTGSLRFGDRPPTVTRTTVVLDASAELLPDLTLTPVDPPGGTVTRPGQPDRRILQWSIVYPPERTRFEVTAASRAPGPAR